MSRSGGSTSWSTLTGCIEFWIASLGNKNSASRWRRFEAFCEGSWTVFIVNSVIASLGLIRLFEIWTKESFNDATPQICMLTGYFTCFLGEWVFINQRQGVEKAFSQLLFVAKELKAEDEGKMKRYTLLVARRARRWYTFETGYTIVSMCGVLGPPLLLNDVQWQLWGWHPDTRLEIYALCLVEFLITPFAYAAYKSFAMVLNANMCSAALFRILGNRISEARGEKEFLVMAKLHSLLDAAAAAVDEQFNVYATAFTLAMLVGASLSTYNVLAGYVDIYCLTPGQFILFLFMPICETGQALEEASGTDLVLAVYSGSWLDESIHTRTLCLAIMARASKPCRVSARAIGSLNLPICQSSLKAWFQYTQLLFNLQK